MPFYRDLKLDRLYSRDEADWIARRLLDLRAQLKSPAPRGVPNRTLNSSLIIGTWNIRDFDNNKFRHGPRRRESLHYIAEIISAFDICAVQEINEDLDPLKQVLKLLGPSWDFIATDVTQGPGGNRERMAFVYDTRKVQFRHVAGEVVIPKHKLLAGEQQFARTPFLVSFQSGWFRFSLCTVHIYFGDDSPGSEGYKRRVEEIDYIARDLAERGKRDNETYVILGDFNIKNPMDETMTALTKAGFQLPPELFPSNLLGNKYYDQIAFSTRKDIVTFLSAGVFNFAETVYTESQYPHYAPALPERHRDLAKNGAPLDRGKDKDYYLKRWRTWQMSDHLPLWVELAVDFSDEYLARYLDDEIAARGGAAQLEEDYYPVRLSRAEVEVAAKAEALEPEQEPGADADKPAKKEKLPKPVKQKKRKAPKKPEKDKVGVARVERPFTLGEMWRIFKYVASGDAEKVRRFRKAQEKKARAARKAGKKG